MPHLVPMHTLLAILTILFACLTLGVLGMGVISFAIGKSWHQRHSTKMMLWRVGLQGVTILMLGLFLITA